ncbi:replicative DNA helicase [bacterium]|jgi:replicative DNA helicase|nr:replicative DNA helicase [bacterium]MBT6293503.1 replicative DNA helicase [bacterium]
MNQLKAPPQSIDAEKSVLGSILLDPDGLIKIVDLIDHDDFYVPAHKHIYNSIFDLFNKRVNIDVITLNAILHDKGQLDKIGGASYLAELVDFVPTSSHIFQYAQIVKKKATLRKLLKAGQDITALGFDENTDVENLLEDAEKSLFSVSQTFVKDKFVHIKDVLTETYEKIAELHDSDAKDKFSGLPYGFRDLDGITSGMHPSDLIILAARPAMGKTSFALNIAQNAALKNKSVGVISLEMSKDQLVERMFCSLLQVDSWKIKTGQLDDRDFAKMGPVMDKLNSMKLFIDDSLSSSVVELRAKTRRLQMEHGLDLIIIDYLQLMSSGKHGFSSNRVNEISDISRSLKSLARELNVPIIALSQLSRAVESRPDKRPILSDLRESGAIEQDADLVMMLYRDDYYNPEDSSKPGVTDLLIRKHRHGAVGTVELMFKKEQMKFYNLEKNRSQDFEDGAPPPQPGPQQRNHGHLKPVNVSRGQSNAKNIMPEF